jgi:uncharacterized protein (DUF2126 family)
VQLADEGMIPDEPKGVTRDVVDLHAWAEVFLPGAGWIGLDATSGLLCGEGHIPLASTASPSMPRRSTARATSRATRSSSRCDPRLGHEVRPTAPYTDEVWSQLSTQGRANRCSALAAWAGRWIGGEPTFNSRATPEQGGVERRRARRRRSGRRASRSRERAVARLAPGGLILRQGKVYPGESLPRWALDVIAAPRRQRAVAGAVARRRGARRSARDRRSPKLAARARHLAAFVHRGVRRSVAIPAQRSELPVDVDPRTPTSTIPRSAGASRRSSIAASAREAGFVLPLAREGETWKSERWDFRRERLFLIPGDSPIGLRLPLESLPAAAQAILVEPMSRAARSRGPRGPRRRAARSPRSRRPRHRAEAPRRERRPKVTGPPPHGPRGRAARRALCVFLPPLPRFADFSRSSRDRSRAQRPVDDPVLLEGYPPPSSPELYPLRGHAGSRRARGEPPARRGFERGGRAVITVFDAALTRASTRREVPRRRTRRPAAAVATTSPSAARTLESPFVRDPISSRA